MVDLLSIAPLIETVEVRGAKVPVKGTNAKGIIGLLNRFPDLMKMWSKGEWETNTLLELSDEVLAALISSGVESLDEANAMNLSLDEKVELIGAVIRVTMPRGPVPFVESLVRLMDSVGGPEGASRKALAMKLRKPSSNSSREATASL